LAKGRERRDELLAGEARQLWHSGEREALYPDEFEILDLFALDFQAKLRRLANPLHQLVERLCLGMTSFELRNRGNVDLQRARKALKEKGSVPWKKVKAELGL
jgi:hypothetical protein